MSAFDHLFAQLKRPKKEGLPSLPEEAGILDTATCHVHTADDLVILTVNSSGARAIADFSAKHSALQLRGPEDQKTTRIVTFVPVKHQDRIALDPNEGWIFPFDKKLGAQLSELPDTEGDYTFDGYHLAIVVEK